MKKTILIFSLLLFVFCTKKEDLKTQNTTLDSFKTKSEQPKFENVFENHLYIVGPHLDDNGNLELGCDCCLSKVYFVDSNKFVYACYCLEGDDFLFGEYALTEKGLDLKFKNKRLTLEYNLYDVIEDTTHTLDNTVKYKEDNIKSSITNWKKFYKSKFYKTSHNEFTEECDSLKKSFIEFIHNDKEVSKFLRKNNIKI